MKKRFLIPDKASVGEIDWIARAIGHEVLAWISAYTTRNRNHRRFLPLSAYLSGQQKETRNLSKFNPRNPGDGGTA